MPATIETMEASRAASEVGWPFAHSRAELDAFAAEALQVALRVGATDATIRLLEADNMSVGIRNGNPETLLRSATQRATLTIFNGQRSGSASTSDLSPGALNAAIERAWRIAHYSGEDPFGGPADSSWLEHAPLDLDLYHPRDLSFPDATDLCQRVERAALDFDPAIKNSEGASVSTKNSHFSLATSRGFLGGYTASSHALQCSVIAGGAEGMQVGHWASECRKADQLEAPEQVGRRSAKNARRMLGARKLPTGSWPVLFEAPVASSLLSSLVGALSGGSQFRKMSFLTGGIGERIMSDHLRLRETPHEPQGLGSAPFDVEGVRTVTRDVVLDGVLQGYFLDTYSARRLAMQSTGYAGGARNLTLASSRTQAADDFPAMLKQLGRGLVVTRLLGNGVNGITGDYSRGAAGFWVEAGVIQYPVHGYGGGR